MGRKNLVRYGGLLACLCLAVLAMCINTADASGGRYYAIHNEAALNITPLIASAIDVASRPASEVADPGSTSLVAFASPGTVSVSTSTESTTVQTSPPASSPPIIGEETTVTTQTYQSYSGGGKYHYGRSPSASRKMARSQKKLNSAANKPLIVHLE